MNILVVEDEHNLRSEMAFFLEMEGHNVETAEDGMCAWEILDDHTPDVVITDIKMPRMSGLELLKQIRNSHIHLPVIIVSAYAAQEWLSDAETLGVSDYLTKPFDLDQLLETTKRVVGGA